MRSGPPRTLRSTPRVLLAVLPLLNILASSGLTSDHDLDAVEFFSGVQSIAKGFRYLGMRSMGIDRRDSDDRCLLSSQGFLLALQLLRRCKAGALTWWAPPCGTWVFMSRGSTKRSPGPCKFSVKVWEGRFMGQNKLRYVV